MTPIYVFLDLETYSEVDVREIGAHAYARHPSTEILIACMAVNEGPVTRYDVANDGLTEGFATLLANRAVRVVAHNCTFEREVLRECAGIDIPLERWEDSSVLALTCGLPAKMETLCKVLGFDDEEAKLSTGKKLINTFCKPNPANYKVQRYTREHKPERWAEFIEYCARDVEVSRTLWNALPRAVYESERGNWLLNRRINERGIPVDVDFIDAAIATAERLMALANDELATLTGGAVDSVTQLAGMREWLEGFGLQFDSLDKASVTALLARDDLPAPARRALELRQEAGKSSVSKFIKAREAAVSGRVYGGLQFYGANRTGREAGRLIQPQNMPRPSLHDEDLDHAVEAIKRGTLEYLFDEPMEALASAVRAMIAAPPGRKLVVADLANIEGRMLAWLAGEQWKLDAFRAYDAGEGPDLYRLTYSRAFEIPVEKVTKDERQVGKVMELAFGYQGGHGAWGTMAAAYNVNLPGAVVQACIEGWRGAHPKVRALWYGCEQAARKAIEQEGKTFEVRGLRFRCGKHGRWRWLTVKLPSGRTLCYFEPRVDEDGIRYVGQLSERGGAWGEVATYGGKFVENFVQALSRDVLMHGLHAIEASGDAFEVFLDVHDEADTEAPDSPEHTVDRLCGYLAQRPSWCPDLPLAAAGYEAKFYRKD